METGAIGYYIFTAVDLAALLINLRIIIDLKNIGGGVFAGVNPESRAKRTMFLLMCSLAMIENITSVINDIIIITMDIMYRFTDSVFLQVLQMVDVFLSGAVSTLLVLLWMLFVDHCVYKSLEHFKKRYPPYFVMAGIGILISAVSSCFTISISLRQETTMWAVVMVLDTFIVLPVLQLIFAVTAYRIVAGYQKERRPPLFLRLSVFIIPVVAGCVIGGIVHSSFASLGFAIGLLLTWKIQGNRSRYMDRDSGFYTQDFLRVMYDHLEKRGYLNGKGVIFSAPGNTDALVKAVSQLDYDNIELFLLEDGKVLLTTGEQKQEVMELIIRYVRAVASAADSPFEISTDTIERSEGESAGSFTARIIETAGRLAQ